MEAILVIDMLNDFVAGKLKCERAQKIIPNIKRLVESARKKGIPVIYSNDAHLQTDYELGKWGKHAMKGTKMAEVIPQLKPEKEDCVLEKRAYSGFFETGLASLLRSLKVDTLILTGLHTNLCVRHTAADAFFRGYEIKIPKDATDAFTENAYKEGLQYLKEYYNAEITDTDKIIKEWK